MSQITYAQDGQVGIITMNRLPVNSIDINFVRDFDVAVDAAEMDGECLVVVVRSSLPGLFSGGGDIQSFRDNGPRENMEMLALLNEALNKLAQSGKIYIAEIGGHALGGGYEIALACDLRFAAAGQYRIGLPEIGLGLMPAAGGTQRLAALIGPARALEFMITGTSVTADDALPLGLVNRLFNEAELTEQTLAFARQLISGATLAIGQIKRSIYDGYCSSLPVGLAVERRSVSPLFASQDVQEGLAAFIERRKPHFTGQ